MNLRVQYSNNYLLEASVILGTFCEFRPLFLMDYCGIDLARSGGDIVRTGRLFPTMETPMGIYGISACHRSRYWLPPLKAHNHKRQLCWTYQVSYSDDRDASSYAQDPCFYWTKMARLASHPLFFFYVSTTFACMVAIPSSKDLSKRYTVHPRKRDARNVELCVFGMERLNDTTCGCVDYLYHDHHHTSGSNTPLARKTVREWSYRAPVSNK